MDWCFRLVLWGVTFAIVMIPGYFLARIVGRVAGFRPGPKAGDTAKVFGWIGAAILSTIILSICLVAVLIDWAFTNAIENAKNFPPFHQPPGAQHLPLPEHPNPKPIPGNWDEQKMAKTYLSDLQERDVRVGWGTFGKKGKLGYDVMGNTDIKVNGSFYPNAISMHPPSNGHSTVKYRLNRNAKLFVAHVALSDVENPGFVPQTAATFAVYGDHQLLWISSPLQKNNVAQKCRISVERVDQLELQVHCPGSHSHVRAVWLDPHALR